MAKNCNTSPFYLQGQSPTIQNQVAIIERFLKKQLPNYAVITVSLNGVDIPKDEFGNVNLEIERINYAAGDGISIDDNVINCTITDTTYTAGENISIDENNVISTTVIDDSTQSNKSTWSSNKINSLIQEFNNFTITVVNQLPVIGEPYVLYLVGNGSEEQSNVNDEYLWIVENNVGRWEKIGTTQITILQSDWHQSDTTAQDYIKNKPTDLVRTSDIEGLLRNDGSVYTGKYLEQVTDLDNFQASEGKIVQYIGNSKYTNGYVYKKVGKQTVIPAGTFYYSINDSTQLMVDVAGLRNGMYFRIEPDEISANIIIPDFWALGSLSTGTLGVFPVKIDTQQHTITPLANVGDYIVYNDEVKQIKTIYRGTTRFDNQYYTGFSGCLVEGNISCNTISGYYTGRSVLQNEIRVYENEYGDKFYFYHNTQGNSPIALRRYNDKYYTLFSTTANWTRGFSAGNTTSEIVIDTEEWQQWDVQPREDTSHYVTDSEIGWIEH